jgi:hypothetical protein
MRMGKLMIVALAWASTGLLSARAEKLVEVPQVQVEVVQKDGKVIKVVRGGAQGGDSKAAAASTDPAEPPVQVEMTSPGYYARAGAAGGQKVEVTSGARGTTLKLPTSGAYTGSASVTFKNSAPPMRFKMQLSRLQNYDLQTLSLTSGSVTLQVGSVSTSATTKYFNAKGQEQDTAVGAAYTVTAKRGDNGQVDVELRRAAGATLGKSLTIQWGSAIGKYRLIDG